MDDQPCRELPEGFNPSDQDVICGWARQNYGHAGNRRFRAMIADRALDYRNATAKIDKSNVIISVIRQLREESPTGTGLVRTDQKTGRWMFIGDAKAKDKVGHALRKASSRSHAKEAIQKKEDDVPRAVSIVHSEAGSSSGGNEPLSPLPSRVADDLWHGFNQSTNANLAFDDRENCHPLPLPTSKSKHVAPTDQGDNYPKAIPNSTEGQHYQQYPPQSMWHPWTAYPPAYNGHYGYEYPAYPPPPLPFESNQHSLPYGYAPQSHHPIPQYQAPSSPAHVHQQQGV